MTDDPAAIIDTLYEPEIEFIRLIAEGYTYQEVADAMDTPVDTVKTYGKRVREKIGTNKMVVVVLWAERNGLLACQQ